MFWYHKFGNYIRSETNASETTVPGIARSAATNPGTSKFGTTIPDIAGLEVPVDGSIYIIKEVLYLRGLEAEILEAQEQQSRILEQIVETKLGWNMTHFEKVFVLPKVLEGNMTHLKKEVKRHDTIFF